MWHPDKKCVDYCGVQEIMDMHMAVIHYLNDAGQRLKPRPSQEFDEESEEEFEA